MTPSHLLQILNGIATPPTLSLQAGVELAPQSMGRAGMWFVDGDGVLDVHGYLYWDGMQLYAQSHDPATPLYVQGMPVPLEWTAIEAPVVLALGSTQISFTSVGPMLSDAPTQMGGAPQLPPVIAPVGPAPVMLGAPDVPVIAASAPDNKASAGRKPSPIILGSLALLLIGGAGFAWSALSAPPPPPVSNKTVDAGAIAAPVITVAPPAPKEALPVSPAPAGAKGPPPSPTEVRAATDALLAGREAEALRLFEGLAQKYPDHPELKATAQLLRGLRTPAK